MQSGDHAPSHNLEIIMIAEHFRVWMFQNGIIIVTLEMKFSTLRVHYI